MTNKTERDPEMSSVATSLRQIRKQKGLTLKAVEKLSGGKWKAVVVGSYERQDRALSLNRAIELAKFYQVPLEQLLGFADPSAYNQFGAEPRMALIIDLRRTLNAIPTEPAEKSLQKFLSALCSKRRDWNGEVLSLRATDRETLALILDRSERELLEWLAARRFLFSPR